MLRMNMRVAGVAGLLFAAGVASTVRAQWTVINLHPAGATTSEALAIYGAQQVGMADTNSKAFLWTGSAASARKLNGAANSSGTAAGVYGGHQGGSASFGTGVNLRTHAVMWNGTFGSMVDLHPGPALAYHSMIVGVGESTQVGSFLAPDANTGTFGAGRACMWSGTPESFVDLTPAGFQTGEARGVSGNQQVGATFDDFFGRACMWTGSAASYVNLQPDAALFSAAQCTDGDHQYGVIGILEPVPGLFPVRWSGNADSYELYDIPADTWGEIHGTFGGYQVGYITDTDGVSNSRACIWTSGPGSYSDLQQYLPPVMTESNASAIWRHTASGTTYVVGYGLNSATNQREAVMWVNGTGTNLITSPAAPPDDSAAAGQSLVYAVRVLNAGPQASGTTTLTIDLPAATIATYASAVPAPTQVTSTQLTFDLGSIAGSGAFTDIQITLTAARQGAIASITATASCDSEVDPTNNSATASCKIQGVFCPADFNGDHVVDFFDYLDFVDAFSSNLPSADFNLDSVIDFFDYLDFVDAFSIGC